MGFELFKALFTDKKLRNKRLQICNKCEHKSSTWLLVFNEDSCSKCSCSISKKVALKNTSCPIDKW